MKRKISVKISGVQDNARYDGKMSCDYIYVFSDPNVTTRGEQLYSTVFSSSLRDTQPLMLNYSPYSTQTAADRQYNLDSPMLGLYAMGDQGNDYSFYRREYENYSRVTGVDTNGKPVVETYEFKGQWEPVAVQFNLGIFRDFNVTSGHSYQYIMYPINTAYQQSFANSSTGSSSITGEPVKVEWNEWSLTELIPVENAVDAPILKKTYKADINNVWLFKYSLEPGAQKQTITKNQVNTLGQYSRIAHGEQNYISGDVTCMLGSEIIPYSPEGYIERMWQSIAKPLSTNEKIYMLQKWREIAFSKNPKLLKDMKGQSWIVSITANSNTPFNSYKNQPDKISFSWIQIEDTSNVVIFGESEDVVRSGGCNSQWKPKITYSSK